MEFSKRDPRNGAFVKIAPVGGEIKNESLAQVEALCDLQILDFPVHISGLRDKSNIQLPKAFLSSITLHGLVNCQIWCGPCAGPVYLEDCRDCILHVCGHQVRILWALKSFTLKIRMLRMSNCILHVFTATSVVLEECSANKILPYQQAWYQGIEEDFKVTPIDFDIYLLIHIEMWS